MLILPASAAAVLMIVGFNQHHRRVPVRLLSPDRTFEARIQNDTKGSIQPIDWRILVKSADVRSDTPEDSCEVAWVQGEDAWRSVEMEWRGGELRLRSIPNRTVYVLKHSLQLRAQSCASVPVDIDSEAGAR